MNGFMEEVHMYLARRHPREKEAVLTYLTEHARSMAEILVDCVFDQSDYGEETCPDCGEILDDCMCEGECEDGINEAILD